MIVTYAPRLRSPLGSGIAIETIALHYDGPAAPPRTVHYEVPISVQNAKVQAVLQDAALQDAVSEIMQLAEDDVKRLLV